MGHLRVAVAELPQVGRDAQAGVFEQVLVDRSFPGDGHELVHPRPGDRIALETDGDLRTGPDVQVERHLQPVGARHGGVGEARGVEPAGPDVALVLGEAAIELGRVVGVPFAHAEPVQDDGPPGRLDPADLDAPDARRRARVDVDDEPAVRPRRPRRDARREPARVAIVLVEEGRGGVDLAGRHPAPQPASDEGRRLLDGPAAGVEHLQPARAAERHEVVAQADALRDGGGAGPNVDELAEAEQVGEALANLPHRQRLAGTGLDEAEQRELVDGPPFAEQPHLGDVLPRERRGVGGAGGRRGEGQHGSRRAGDVGTVQNACLTRKSRA